MALSGYQKLKTWYFCGSRNVTIVENTFRRSLIDFGRSYDQNGSDKNQFQINFKLIQLNF